MRYDPDEALRLTLARASALRARSARRRTRALRLETGGCACALLSIGYGLAVRGGTSLREADYGAFLLPSQAGGYILLGVLAFAAGVLVTLLCLRFRNGGADPPVGGSPSGKALPPEAGDRTGPDSRAEQAKIIEENGEGPAERRTTR